MFTLPNLLTLPQKDRQVMHLAELKKTLKAFEALSAVDKKLLHEWEQDRPRDSSCSTEWPGWVRLGILKDKTADDQYSAALLKRYWQDYGRYGVETVARLAKVSPDCVRSFLSERAEPQ